MANSKPNYKMLPIGTPGKPWPTVLRQEVDGVIRFANGVISTDSKPLMLLSTRKFSDVMVDLYRNMPVPGMLPAFKKLVENPLVYLESGPGLGKSFLAVLVGKVMHDKGAVEYDAGGKNMQSLLFETVFDSRKSKDLEDRINKALENNEMTEMSLHALRSLKTKPVDEAESLLSEEDEKKIFDWEGLRESGIDPENIRQVMNDVKAYQEWNGSLNVGFEDKAGKLIQAAMEGRPLNIDEFPRRKPGTEAPLQRVWEVINGDIQELEIPLGNLGTFTLRYGDIPKVIMSGNKPKDGIDVHPISDSLESRLVKAEIPDFTVNDWQHRIDQIMTGVPINTLAKMAKGEYVGDDDKNMSWVLEDGDGFTDSLLALRGYNNTAIPHIQTVLLENWDLTIEISMALAQGYKDSAEILDPDSAVLQKPDLATVLDEVDQPGDAAAKLTPRQTIHHLKSAIRIAIEEKPAEQSDGLDFTQFDEPILAPSAERPEEFFGGRLKDVIMEWICDTCGVTTEKIKRPELYTQLKEIWTNAGILGDKSLLDKLNLSSNDIAQETPSEEIAAATGIINALIKSKYPDSDDIGTEEVRPFIEGLKIRDRELVLDENGVATTSNIIASAENIAEEGLGRSEVQIKIPVEGDDIGAIEKDYTPEKLVSEERILSSLALKPLRKETIKTICALTDKDGSVESEIASADSTTGIAATTILCQGDGRSKVHFLMNLEDEKILVVRTYGSVNSELQKALENSGITYVSQDDKKAEADIEAWIDENITEDHDPIIRAFQLRNAVERITEEPESLDSDDLNLAELISGKDKSVSDKPVILSNMQESLRAK